MLQLLKLLKTSLPISRGVVYVGLAAALAFYVIYLQHQLADSLKDQLEKREQELKIQADTYRARVQRLLDLDAERQKQLAALELKKNKVRIIVKELDSIPEAKEWKDVHLPDSVASAIVAARASLRNPASPQPPL